MYILLIISEFSNMLATYILILLLYHVFTTGSTALACFMALRAALPPSVRISVATLGFVGGVWYFLEFCFLRAAGTAYLPAAVPYSLDFWPPYCQTAREKALFLATECWLDTFFRERHVSQKWSFLCEIHYLCWVHHFDNGWKGF